MEQSAEHAEDWVTCLQYVPVNELGDRDRQSGYLYDERDGTGVGYMDGIAVDRRRRWPAARTTCSSTSAGAAATDNPQPGGTAEPASVRAASARSHRRPGLRRQLTMLERKARRLVARSQRLETISERFDEWESCVSWVPVTELGDPDQKFGYLFGPQGGAGGVPSGAAHRPQRLGRPRLHVPRARRRRPARAGPVRTNQERRSTEMRRASRFSSSARGP